jgi:DNA-binding transcriptional regulator GbsR (MarR family)
MRKAIEKALEVLTNHVEDPRCQKEIDEAVEALHQALANLEHNNDDNKLLRNAEFDRLWWRLMVRKPLSNKRKIYRD